MDEYLITSFKNELFDHNETPGRGNSANSNQDSNPKISLIRIDDTPSPVQGRKHLEAKSHRNSSHKKKKSSSKKKHPKKNILGIPDSPNRIRKLLNPTVNLNFNQDDTLPGRSETSTDDEDFENSPMPYSLVTQTQNKTPRTQVIPRTQLTPLTQNAMTQKTPRALTQNTPSKTQKTPSSLFKPKAKLNANEEEDNHGCDLSFESLQKQQRRRQNPYIVRLSEIFTSFTENLNQTSSNQDNGASQVVLKPVPENSSQSRKSSPDVNDLLSGLVSTYFNETQHNINSFTRVSMFSQSDSISTQSHASESQLVVKTEPITTTKTSTANETSRFEYTMSTNSSNKSKSNQIQIGDAFNMSSLLSSLDTGSQSTSSQRSNLSHAYEEEESRIVIHQPILNTEPTNSLMSKLLDKIDQVFASLQRLNGDKTSDDQQEAETSNEDSSNRISKIFTNREAQNIDNELISQFHSLKNSAGGHIMPALSQSILNNNSSSNPGQPVNKNVVSDVLTDMLTSFFSETQIHLAMQMNQFDSTKITDENRVIKEEIETPDITNIDEFDVEDGEIRAEPAQVENQVEKQTQELLSSICSQLSQLSTEPVVMKTEMEDVIAEMTDDLTSETVNEPFVGVIRDTPVAVEADVIRDTPVAVEIKTEMDGEENIMAELTDDLTSSEPVVQNHVIKDTPVGLPPALVENTEVQVSIIEPTVPTHINLNKEHRSLVSNEDNNSKASETLEPSKQLKKVMKKKLLDPNRFINDDDSLPGSPSGTPNAKKPLSLFKYTPKVFTPSISTPSLFKPKSDLPTFESSRKGSKKQTKSTATPTVVLGKPPKTPSTNKNTISLSQKLSDLADDSSLDISVPFSDKMIQVETPSTESKRPNKQHLSRQIFNKELEKALSKSEKSLKPKKIVLCHLNLKSTKLNELKETISVLNDANSDSSDTECLQLIQASQQKVFNLNTTHLIVDFESTFDNREYDLKTKMIIILAVLNKCKIIRYEWLVHSKAKLSWQDETKYMLENYLSEDLSEYEDDDFDIQVVRLIRTLRYQKSTKNSLDVFARYKNIFLIKERSETNSKSNTEFDDVMLFEKKSALQTYLAQIISKCGGETKSRVAEAEFMVAVDKTNDYDETIPNQLNKIRLDRGYFVECVKKLKTLVTDTIDVVSSEWILDCILENPNLEKEDYNLISLVPE